MKLQHTKATLTAIWVLAMLAFASPANTTSISEWTTLAALTVIPPIALWLFWNDPAQSMSESIHRARR
jgi:ABC-type nickel/cobalt efflux system permease component RcnA